MKSSVCNINNNKRIVNDVTYQYRSKRAVVQIKSCKSTAGIYCHWRPSKIDSGKQVLIHFSMLFYFNPEIILFSKQ